MNLWEEFEEYLFDHDAAGSLFNNRQLAEDWGISGSEASRYIQSYLGAQVRKDANTLYVLHREGGRTTNAMWKVGVRSRDAHKLGKQTVNDFRCRLRRFVEPTLASMGQHNPRAVPAAEATLKGLEAGLELLLSIIGDEQD